MSNERVLGVWTPVTEEYKTSSFLFDFNVIRLQQRGRKQLRNDRSDDEYDRDYPEQHNSMGQEEESITVMLRCLPPNVTEDDVSLTPLERKSHRAL